MMQVTSVGIQQGHRASAAKVGVMLAVLGDAVLMASLIAGDIYLASLNVGGQFKGRSESAPSVMWGLGVTLVAVASAGWYWAGLRRLRKSPAGSMKAPVWGAWGLVVLGLVAQVWLIATQNLPSPVHGYGSMLIILLGYHAFHLLVTAVVGILLIGRIARKRVADHSYVFSAAGLWWAYVAVSAVVLWLATALIG